MKKTLHYWVLYILIRVAPKLFDRYYKEYDFIRYKYFRNRDYK